ncbi:hypothetical protein FB470_007155 [Amycolatopsis thermophila]|uniref:Uncharacterized protein n=1 Tax=Amycolatopsis thermophila TaxID=206084 RepID=A0ABU0F6E6_9PSEU|nr:hypothetical protein [Amycolatopsis thermophila]
MDEARALLERTDLPVIAARRPDLGGSTSGAGTTPGAHRRVATGCR